MTKHPIRAALLASVAFVSGSANARFEPGAPAAPDTPNCRTMTNTMGLGYTTIADLDSPAAALPCSAPGDGGRQKATVSVSDRDPLTCIRIKLGTPAPAFWPSCFPVAVSLGCRSVVDLN